MVSPFMPDAEKVAAIRQLLPATRAGIYLNAGSVGPLSSETVAAITEVIDRELAVGRADRFAFPTLLERLGEARAGVAAILATDLDRIAITQSTTHGLNAVLGGLGWERGDRVVTSTHEHPAVLGALVALRERAGVAIDLVEVPDDADDDAIDAAFGAVVPGARALVVSHMLWTTGRVMPVARMAAAARAAGAWAIVDGAQAAGAIIVHPDDLGADAYALSGQKWLLGPEGTGALWLGDRAFDELTPGTPGFFAFESLDRFCNVRWHAGGRRFETAGFQPASIVGLARACGWLSMFVGLPWAVERAAALAGLAAERLAAIDGVTLLTPPAAMGTLVSFRIAGWPAERVVEELATRVFAVVRDVPAVSAIRLSVGWWNTDEELERVLATVSLLAQHTPETLPARRLTVLGSDGAPLE